MFIDPDGQWPDWGKLWNNISSWYNGTETYAGQAIEEVVVYGNKAVSGVSDYLGSVDWKDVGNTALRDLPVIGSSIISGDYLNNRQYGMATLWFSYSAFELFTFGYGTSYIQAQRSLAKNIATKSVPVVEVVATKGVNSSAHLASEAANFSKHLGQIEKYGQAGFKELQNGRFRYYGNVTPASSPGEMIGRRVVREWNPANGRTRTWMETLDGAGSIRIVRPETGGKKVHFMFDKSGNFIKKW